MMIVELLQMNQALNFKYIIIGTSEVGKTSILKRLIDKKFVMNCPPTVGIEYFSYNTTIDSYDITIMAWDTAGQERFYNIVRAYFRSAIGVVLTFDITNRKSFEELPRWLRDAREEVNPHAVTVLVGNKCDLADTRVVTREEAEQFAADNNLTYFESSALSNINIDDIFLRSAHEIVRKITTGEIDKKDVFVHRSSLKEEDIEIRPPQSTQEKKPCCCCSK